MSPPPTNLRSPPLVSTLGVEAVLRTLEQGRPATAMPGWRHLGRERLLDLVSYLWSLQSEER